MRDTNFEAPLPSPPAIHGVHVQKVLTLSELVFVFGRYRKNRQVLHTNMMGVALSYRITPSQFIINQTEQTITVTTDKWTVDIRHISLSKGRDQNDLFPSTRLLRWGKESVKLLVSADFAGDVETFQRDLLYAQMMGDDYDAWDEMILYREGTT